MDAILERCCGLDVHQASVVACTLIGDAHQRPRKEVRTFRTVTKELIEMREWLRAGGCTHVAMESTGIYWKPVYAILEDSVEIVVGNAQHIKNVPGRKTDVKDSEWIADLLRHGLIAKSFVPPAPIRELRDLTRYRRKLVESRSAEQNRLLRLLETANIKLSSVASDVFGVSGTQMLHALLSGTSTPQAMAELARGRLRKKIPDLELALEGRVEEHHRVILGVQLRRLEQTDEAIAEIEQRIEEKLTPYQKERELLKGIPGIDVKLAAAILAELGVDMSVFHSAEHLAAWAGVTPGNNESAGKRKNSRIRKGNVHLKTALVEAANAATRKNGSYLKEKFYRLKVRRGHKRAVVAIAHKMLISIYHMLSTNTAYHDLGQHYLDRLSQQRTTSLLVHRLERLGYNVDIKLKDAA